MEVLVTGAAGLLGSNVVTRAFDAGHHVTETYHTTVPEPRFRLDASISAIRTRFAR